MEIREVYINGLNYLPRQCFYRCKFLKTVSFSILSSVMEFHRKSLSMCGLETLQVPRSVRIISSKCFYWCRLLKEITFEEGSCLEVIEEKAFMNTSLLTLVVPPGVNSVTGTSFYGVSDVIFSEGSVLSICDGFLIHNEIQSLVSFLGDESESVVIPSKIRVIGSQSFYRCGQIKSLSFESPSEVECIEDDAFKHCRIGQLQIPVSLSRFGRNVLSHVNSVVVDEGHARFNWNGDSILTRVLDDESISLIRAIGRRDVVRIPDYVRYISSFCDNGKRGFVLDFSSDGLCEMSGFGPREFQGSDILSVNFPQTTESIEDKCFKNCQFLLNVSLHGCHGLRSLGSFCFAKTSISKMTIPYFVESLSSHAFSYCLHLAEAEFEENSRLRVIGEYCFSGCLNLRVLVPPDTVQVIGDRAFDGSRISEFKFPLALSTLGKRCFSRNLARISSFSGLEMIPDSCFCESQLKSVEIPARVLKIKSGAFCDCHVLESVTFETGSLLHSIGSFAFCDTSISEILLPGTLQRINS